jgi:hypothetical protein
VFLIGWIPVFTGKTAEFGVLAMGGGELLWELPQVGPGCSRSTREGQAVVVKPLKR